MDELQEYLAEMERRNTSYHIQWSALTKLYRLTIPWMGTEYAAKTLLEVLKQAVGEPLGGA